MTNSSTRNMIRIRFTIMAFSILGLVLTSLKSAITRFAIALQDRARLSITEPNKPILAHSFQQLMERILGDLLIAALASALSVRLVLLVYSRLLRDNSNSDSDAPSHSASIKVKLALDWSITGPEFDYLKTIKEISRNEEITAFVEKAHSSLEYRGSFMQLDPYERSLLHYAAMGNCTSLLLFPLQSSPNIDSRDHWGRTPLSWAAENTARHDQSASAVVFSLDGSRVVSGSRDKTIKIWDAHTETCLQTLNVGNTTNSSLHTSVGIFALCGSATPDLTTRSKSSVSELHSPSASQLPQPPEYQGYGISSDRFWITRGSHNWLWLPPTYRPARSAVGLSGLAMVLGCPSGRVLIFEFAPGDAD
ncbi:unnamed protein product [Penicillium pancosmium]